MYIGEHSLNRAPLVPLYTILLSLIPKGPTGWELKAKSWRGRSPGCGGFTMFWPLTWLSVFLCLPRWHVRWLQNTRKDIVMSKGRSLQKCPRFHCGTRCLLACSVCQPMCTLDVHISSHGKQGKGIWGLQGNHPRAPPRSQRTSCDPVALVGPQRNPIEHEFYVITFLHDIGLSSLTQS